MAKSPDNRITNKDTENGKKESKSRRSVEIKKVEDKNKRHVTFSKRKRGLFNKTAELSVLTGAETGAIVVSNSGKVFCFVSPSPDAIIERYYSKKQIQDYEKASRLLKEEKILKGGKKSTSNNNGGDEGGCSYGWWERPIGMMSSLEELEEYREAMYKLKHNVETTSPSRSDHHHLEHRQRTPSPTGYGEQRTTRLDSESLSNDEDDLQGANPSPICQSQSHHGSEKFPKNR
ncbi:hypothetical protein ACFX13_047020 [Malus domestica]